MRISRIFRKYSRVLLLVFMSLLLVVFLLGDVIGRARYSQQMQDIEIGQAFGKPVYLSQTRHAEADFTLARQLEFTTPPVASDDPREQNLAMYLLLEEARRAGIRVGRDQIVEAMRNRPRASAALDMIRRRSGRSLNSIYDSVARVSATIALARYQLEAATATSLPELEQAYRDQNQTARVLVSVIDSRALLPQVPTPTERELQAHFEEAKDRNNEHSEETLAYGYRIPDRVQIEYLTVDPADIQPSVHVREKEAKRYYEDNQQKYMKTVEDTSPFALEEAPPQRIQASYDELKEQVREDCRAAKAILEAQRLVNLIQQEARRPWVTARLSEGNDRQTPPADAIVSFAELQSKYSKEYPVIYKKTELATQFDLRRERGFGRAAAIVDRLPVPAAILAFWIEGLATAEPDDRTPLLRENEPGPVVIETRAVDQAGGVVPYQAYVFRVTRVEPSGPPKSLDEVREKAVENVRQIKALELAGKEARVLAERARNVGLEQAVAEAGDLKALLRGTDTPAATQPAASHPSSESYVRMLAPFEPERFLRRAGFVNNVGFTRSLHEKVFACADEDNLDASKKHRLVVVPIANNLKWVVAEMLELRPIYGGEFDMKRGQLEREVAGTAFQTFARAWFSPDNIFRRAAFVPAAPETQPEPDGLDD